MTDEGSNFSISTGCVWQIHQENTEIPTSHREEINHVVSGCAKCELDIGSHESRIASVGGLKLASLVQIPKLIQYCTVAINIINSYIQFTRLMKHYLNPSPKL